MSSDTVELSRLVHPFEVHGEVHIRPSKSELHRALICAALAEGESKLSNFAYSEDISATMGALEALGLAIFETQGDVCSVHGGRHDASCRDINCVESGTTQRLIFPLALDGTPHVLKGSGRLLDRPFGPYEQLCLDNGYQLYRTANGIEVNGVLGRTDVFMPGNISSQFISGMLIGLSRVEGTSTITITTPLESEPYVDMTRQMMDLFGVDTRYDGIRCFVVQGRQDYIPTDVKIEGDYSHAAFFAAAAALAGRVKIYGLTQQSMQGDRAIFDILRGAGAGIVWGDNWVEVTSAPLKAMDVDVSQIPDLVPVLAALACGASGTTYLRNAGRLRHKESDRLEAMCTELSAIGANISEHNNTLTIKGGRRLSGGLAHAHNDHRVAMALCVASLVSSKPVLINGTNSVRKSAPEFFEDWNRIGGSVT